MAMQHSVVHTRSTLMSASSAPKRAKRTGMLAAIASG
jgi:hypothetical protein